MNSQSVTQPSSGNGQDQHDAPTPPSPRRGSRWRIAAWGMVAFLLLLPLIAMQFTDEVNWTASDFLFAAILFGTIGGAYEIAVRVAFNGYQRAGYALALLSTFLIIWANGAVGMIGNEDNPVNMVFIAVAGIAWFGSLIGRFRPRGMAIAMTLAGAAQASIGLWAAISGTDVRGGMFTMFLSTSWFLAAMLFWAAYWAVGRGHVSGK